MERFFGGFDSRPTVYALTILSMVKIKFILLKCKQFRRLGMLYTADAQFYRDRIDEIYQYTYGSIVPSVRKTMDALMVDGDEEEEEKEYEELRPLRQGKRL